MENIELSSDDDAIEFVSKKKMKKMKVSSTVRRTPS